MKLHHVAPAVRTSPQLLLATVFALWVARAKELQLDVERRDDERLASKGSTDSRTGKGGAVGLANAEMQASRKVRAALPLDLERDVLVDQVLEPIGRH